ncbi:ElyC/SanA/YdcF family protein [Aureibaculum sp. 2210JD6-5]|uniref:SanA/YdcF family protein n=1 Tax=Aureibaculum sp. 2210JD6-5 TaxID=3103957 RepID=UPI002AAD0F28|nr:ElyC/SanA/YdcF family protein [Aureibaculum sp. 2210JD6-5]MDY7394345.1 ElyC/SanA/YdcF family protein [Aureibaculum sp. 2210JD6-5]
MRKRLKYIILAIIIIPLSMIFMANYSIVNTSENKVFDKTTSIQPNKVGLILGTSKLLKNGRINLFYQYRVDAAVALYKAEKIEFILVSGDNSSVNNDEPTDFKNDLIANGIPAEKIFLDYAGFRTLDSVVRAKEIFGLTEVTFISQKFHNQRAIYLAEKNGIKAIGYNAKDVGGQSGTKVMLREYLARVKVFVDLLFGVEPHFLGEKIEIK